MVSSLTCARASFNISGTPNDSATGLGWLEADVWTVLGAVVEMDASCASMDIAERASAVRLAMANSGLGKIRVFITLQFITKLTSRPVPVLSRAEESVDGYPGSLPVNIAKSNEAGGIKPG